MEYPLDTSQVRKILSMLKSIPAASWVEIGVFFHPEHFYPDIGGSFGRHGYAISVERDCFSVGVECERILCGATSSSCRMDNWYLSRGMDDILNETLPPRYSTNWGLWSRKMSLCEKIYWSIRERRENERAGFLARAGIKRTYTQ